MGYVGNFLEEVISSILHLTVWFYKNKNVFEKLLILSVLLKINKVIILKIFEVTSALI